MTKWVISIVGVVFLGLLLDMVYPNGRTNKLCKSIFGIIVLVVIIKPIFNVNLDMVSDNYIDEMLESSLSDSKINILKKEIEGALLLSGLDGVFVEIDGKIEDNKILIENVTIDISNVVLLKNFENINKYEVIIKEVKKVVDIHHI
jgi:stage III sporulation protein AF